MPFAKRPSRIAEGDTSPLQMRPHGLFPSTPWDGGVSIVASLALVNTTPDHALGLQDLTCNAILLPGPAPRPRGAQPVSDSLKGYPGRWTTTTWPGGDGEGFWHHAVMEHKEVIGHEFKPDEHKGYPRQYVWVIEAGEAGDSLQ